MKIERTEDDYGGGSGREVFESDIFRVVRWKHYQAVSTTIECKLVHDMDLRFDGEPDFRDDETCMTQFTCTEILQMISAQKEISFGEGNMEKAKELRECLGI